MKYLKDKSTKNILEDISQHCFTNIVPYKYSKHLNRGSAKYRKGRITTYEWINDLTFYYLKKEKNLKNEFIFYLNLKIEEIEVLNDGDYKKGILDTLDELLKRVEKF